MEIRNKGIIAYGTQEDREKLKVMAESLNMSNSEFLIKLIREKYEKITGFHQT